MDKMELWESYIVCDNLSYTDTNTWEQNRTLITMLANMFSKKKLSAQDIMKFSWDKSSSKGDIEISDNDITRLKARANEISKQIKHGNNTNKTN